MLASHLTRHPTSSCFSRKFMMLIPVCSVAIRWITSGAYCFLALILMLLAKWVYCNISVGNIILVKDEDGK